CRARGSSPARPTSGGPGTSPRGARARSGGPERRGCAQLRGGAPKPRRRPGRVRASTPRCSSGRPRSLERLQSLLRALLEIAPGGGGLEDVLVHLPRVLLAAGGAVERGRAEARGVGLGRGRRARDDLLVEGERALHVPGAIRG